jgi:hypothetical protein
MAQDAYFETSSSNALPPTANALEERQSANDACRPQREVGGFFARRDSATDNLSTPGNLSIRKTLGSAGELWTVADRKLFIPGIFIPN